MLVGAAGKRGELHEGESPMGATPSGDYPACCQSACPGASDRGQLNRVCWPRRYEHDVLVTAILASTR